VYVLIVFVIANGDKSAMMNSRETSRLKPAYILMDCRSVWRMMVKWNGSHICGAV